MGFWKKIFDFRKKEIEEPEYGDDQWDWENLLKERDLLKINDDYQREKYVRSCLEQIKTASEELDKLSYEYNLVTSYLKDMEEIETLPKEEKSKLEECAKQVVHYETERTNYLGKHNRMTDQQFRQMDVIAENMPKAYDSLKEAENYQKLIRQDLSQLDGERHAYQYRKNELVASAANMKGMVVISVAAMIVCMIMLMILQFAFDMDTQIGYVIAAGAGALALTLLYIKYAEATEELKKVDKSINRIILLQNTVKIRYVNNVNLVEYLYEKYRVGSAREMDRLWKKYLEEQKERSNYSQAQDELDFYQKELAKNLRRYQLNDASIWIHQAEALLDSKEMVEIRHDLIVRRQKLRAQMDYNRRLAKTGQEEIKVLVDKYPRYAKEILDLVSKYEVRT